MEDSHYFLKSINLESYIDHEKNFCESLTREEMDNLDYSSLGYSKMKIEETGEKAQEMDIPGKTDGINEEVSQIMGSVHADDFFSSLELQSSSKMSSSVINFPSFPKMTCGIVTRSRSHVATSHDVSQKIIDKPGRKEKVKRQGKTVRNRVRKKVSKCKRDPDKGKKSKVRGRNSQVGKRSSLDVKSAAGSDGRKNSQSSVKTEDGVTVRGVPGDKNKEDDWVFFQHLGMRRDVSMEDKLLGHELNATGRRSTPELFSISPILMTDDMSEEKDKVDKLLSVDDYDETFLEEMEEFSNAPPRSHTGGKWKPGSLPVRSSPILWQSQNWESFLDDRNTNYEASGKITSETSVEPPVESHEGKGQSLVSTGGKWKSFAPPASHTGGKWKPMTPPATYTGGKWKPSEVPQRTKVVDNTEPSWKSQSSSSSSGPPISHTGGKWKPNSADHCREDLTSGKVKSNVPSPSHTHGKWVSGPVKGSSGRTPLDIVANSQRTSGKCLKTSGGMIQYYCSPCNRRLSSKKMYRNHVQSELHLKRVLQENDLEFDSRSLKMFRGLFTQTVRKERGLGKRLVKPPEMYKATEVETSKKEKKSVELKGKKRPRKEMVRCEVCKIKVPSYQLGKHLVSYYHIRRMQLNDPVQRNLILSNIHAIVKQAPYQCGLCKFYCNTHVLFKKHWALSVHKEAEQQQGHRFWCALCNFECETTKSMELHLDSNSHREVIQAVNKSIPIIIRHKFVFSCSICFKEFRFSRELTRHREVHHPETLDADAGNKFACTLCDQSFKSMKSLQKHIIHMHKGDVKIPYFCSTCNEFFATVTEAKNHRNGQLHKYKKALADSGGLPQKKGLVRTCTYCGDTLENIDKLKSHLYDRHRSLLPKCIKCGMTFALSQEVSRHVKNRECDFSIKRSEGPASGAFKCDVCTFSTDSQSEFLLHTAIHQKGREETKKIACPLCGTSYTQAALSVHLRTHLKEKTYQCSMCSSTFVRKDRYVAHLKSKHLLKDGEVSGSKDAGTEQATQESQRSTPKENEGEESGELGQTTRENQSGKSATEKRLVTNLNCSLVRDYPHRYLLRTLSAINVSNSHVRTP
ncbi:hypothetical protein RUM43_005647 [Polyplax serrata]|uniref:C2H2-type domain-containing protein n=1 Tax=Polyplax serrata TaxID=468196 RepID=A0AAN8PJR9_POLSC